MDYGTATINYSHFDVMQWAYFCGLGSYRPRSVVILGINRLPVSAKCVSTDGDGASHWSSLFINMPDFNSVRL